MQTLSLSECFFFALIHLHFVVVIVGVVACVVVGVNSHPIYFYTLSKTSVLHYTEIIHRKMETKSLWIEVHFESNIISWCREWINHALWFWLEFLVFVWICTFYIWISTFYIIKLQSTFYIRITKKYVLNLNRGKTVTSDRWDV